MTCIVGLESSDGVWLGSDSFLGNGQLRDLTDGPKWFRRGEMLVGFAGDFAPAQRMARTRFRKRKRAESAEAYLHEVVAPRARSLLGSEGDSPTEFLVAIDGRVWLMQSDFSVVRSAHGFTAIGDGLPYALGALAATASMDPERRVRAALEAAAKLCPTVSAPFFVERVAA